MDGAIKSYCSKTGWGTIAGADLRDYRFHRRDVVDGAIKVRYCGMFMPSKDKNGLRAKEIILFDIPVEDCVDELYFIL